MADARSTGWPADLEILRQAVLLGILAITPRQRTMEALQRTGTCLWLSPRPCVHRALGKPHAARDVGVIFGFPLDQDGFHTFTPRSLAGRSCPGKRIEDRPTLPAHETAEPLHEVNGLHGWMLGPDTVVSVGFRREENGLGRRSGVVAAHPWKSSKICSALIGIAATQATPRLRGASCRRHCLFCRSVPSAQIPLLPITPGSTPSPPVIRRDKIGRPAARLRCRDIRRPSSGRQMPPVFVNVAPGFTTA